MAAILLAAGVLTACTVVPASPVATVAANPAGDPATPAASAETGDAAAVPITSAYTVQKYPVPDGAHPHDVAPDPAGGVVWYTAQFQGALGVLDPETGTTRHIALGTGSRPHGVVVGPDGAPWITDSGLNAIVRVDPATEEVQVFPLPTENPSTDLNTPVFDAAGTLWFTGQRGIYGRLDPQTGEVEVFAAPRGRGPYGITATPQGDVYYASLAGNHIAHIDPATSAATPIDPPTPGQGARRVWADSQGRIWVSEWNSGQLSVYDPATAVWEAWKLPGEAPQVYAVYVDELDMVWVSEWSVQSLARFDPQTEQFELFPLGATEAAVRQIAGRPGEVWAPESGTDQITVVRRQD
jgi:virginiamycin B lyase